MAVALALAGAIAWGTGDYLGGVTTRRHAVVSVMLMAQMAGLVTLLIGTVVVTGSPTVRDSSLGAAGSLFGALGLVLLYYSLAHGKMSIVAPTTAVTSAALPVLWGVTSGEDLTLLAGFGILAGLIAIGLISQSNDKDEDERRLSTAQSIPIALAAGACFGVLIVVFDNLSEEAGLWPLIAGRGVTIPLFFIAALVTKVKPIPETHRVTATGAGLLDSAANSFVLLAVQEGLLTLTAVLSSLYPAMTVALARVVDKERLQPIQIFGLALAAVAIVCIGGG
jgi:drug/metabolite transporter (DMT)-like permease